MTVRNIQKKMKQANQEHMGVFGKFTSDNEYSSNIVWTYWTDKRWIFGYSTKRMFETVIAGIKLLEAFS